MKKNRRLPDLLWDMLRSRTGLALTVSEHITIGPVTDGQIILATPAATEMYRYPSEKDLAGQYLSTLTNADDLAVSRMLVLSRKQGLTDIVEYRLRVYCGDGSERYVAKVTTQLAFEDKLYWVTEVREPVGEPSATDIKGQFDVPDDVREYLAKHMTVAEMQEVVGKHIERTLKKRLTNITNVRNMISPNIRNARDKMENATAKINQLALMSLKKLHSSGRKTIWIRQRNGGPDAVVFKMTIKEALVRLLEAEEDGKHICLRCMYAAKQYAEDSAQCPNCRQNRTDPYRRTPSVKTRGKAGAAV